MGLQIIGQIFSLGSVRVTLLACNGNEHCHGMPAAASLTFAPKELWPKCIILFACKTFCAAHWAAHSCMITFVMWNGKPHVCPMVKGQDDGKLRRYSKVVL